ncbi:MAG: hypothetical protein EOO71_16590 [Myxococcaceae bacterium]|nr:MAG: hypothetical protein EOO71_16590 [Myxococcaceae bacterium]
MKKLLLGLMLAAGTLVGCGPEVQEAPEENVRTMTSDSGLVMSIVEGGADADGDAVSSMSEPSGLVSAAGADCWVTLLYCKDPRYGTASCKTNGKCTNAQIQKNCEALYQKNC